MEKKKIDYNLQMKIREYLRFIWQEENTQNADIENEIIDKLSNSLKSELMFESYGQVLKKSPLFFANFSEKFLGELMYEIKEVRNIPEDSIFTVYFLFFFLKIPFFSKISQMIAKYISLLKGEWNYIILLLLKMNIPKITEFM